MKFFSLSIPVGIMKCFPIRQWSSGTGYPGWHARYPYLGMRRMKDRDVRGVAI